MSKIKPTENELERRRELVNHLYWHSDLNWHGQMRVAKIAYLLNLKGEDIDAVLMPRIDFEFQYYGLSKQPAADLPLVKYGYLVAKFGNKVFGYASLSQLASFLNSKKKEIYVRGLPCRVERYTTEGVCEACSDYGDHEEDYATQEAR